MEETILIGPGQVSDLEIEQLNEKVAKGWKGHRLMSLVPLMGLIVLLVSYLSGSVRPLALTVVGVPLTAILLGTLFLLPYRRIQTIDYSGLADQQGISIESRINGNRPQVHKVKWKDVVAAEEEDEGLMLYLRSGDKWRLPSACWEEPVRRFVLKAIAASRSERDTSR